MPVLTRSITVAIDPGPAFEAVADFANAALWDPGVVAAERTIDGSDDSCGVGATYRLTVTFRGRRSTMTYRTTAFRRPELVVLEGTGPRIAATDAIAFAAAASGGTRIDYEADLRLVGGARLAGPFLEGAFRSMGDDAIEGMRAWLLSESRAV